MVEVGNTLYPKLHDKPIIEVIAINENGTYVVEFLRKSGQISMMHVTSDYLKTYYYTKAEAILFGRTRKK